MINRLAASATLVAFNCHRLTLFRGTHTDTILNEEKNVNQSSENRTANEVKHFVGQLKCHLQFCCLFSCVQWIGQKVVHVYLLYFI